MKKRRFYYRIASFLMAFLLVVTSADMSVFAAEINSETAVALQEETDLPDGEHAQTDPAAGAPAGSENDVPGAPDDAADDAAQTGGSEEADDAAQKDGDQAADVAAGENAGENGEAVPDEASEEEAEALSVNEWAGMESEDGGFKTGYQHFDGDDKIDIVGNRSGFSTFAAVSQDLPEKYTTPNLPSLRDQNPYGSCWAFTSISLAEISRMKTAGVSEQDYSELALCYFSYNTVEDPLGGTAGDWNKCKGGNFINRGGNLHFSGPVLAGWVGATDEADAPYTDTSKALSGGLNAGIAYKDKAHLTGYYKADIKEDPDAVKQMIRKYGAVGASIYAYTSLPNTAYKADTNSYYVKDAQQSNHAVTIVGWDDTFPKGSFRKTPAGDGAWLVRNSWWKKGLEEYSYYGYFWLSYYDAGLAADVHAFEFAPADNYMHNYQYDGAMQSASVGGFGTTQGANVFRAGACEDGEQIGAAGFLTESANVNYTVQVYTGLTDANNPTSGVLWDTVEGTTTYEGFYTVRFNKYITVEEGDLFSIVVTLEKPESYAYLGCEYTISTSSWYQTNAAAEEGQSFLWWNGSGWFDYGKQNNRNLRIKAYTNDLDKSVPISSAAKIAGDDEVLYGESAGYKVLVFPHNVELGGTVRWTSSDPEIMSVDSKGKLTAHEVGEITLTAEVDGLTTEKTVRCVPHVPKNISCSADEDNRITLRWDPVSEANYYRIVGPDGTPHDTTACTYTDASMVGITSALLAEYKVYAYREFKSYVMGSFGTTEIYLGPPNGIFYEVFAGTNHPGNPLKYSYLDQITLKDPTPPEGYDFGGWYEEYDPEKDEYSKEIKIIDGTQREGLITLYAKYNPHKYRIHYHSNYGGKYAETDEIEYTTDWIPYKYPHNVKYELRTPENLNWKQLPKYTFKHWNTKVSGTGTDYAGGQKVEKMTAQDGAEIDLYAQWNIEADVFELTFDADGGDVHPASIKVKNGSRYGTLPVPVKEGMQFEGWYLSKNYKFADLIDENTVVDLEGNHTVYARYRESVGDVIFRAELTKDGKVAPGTKLYLSTRMGGTKIYYTLDGSEPDPSKAVEDASTDAGTRLYDDAITLREGLANASRIITVRAMAVKDGFIDGSVVTMTYELLDESKNWGEISEEIAQEEEIASAEDIPKGFWVTGVKERVPYTGEAYTFPAMGVYYGKYKLEEKKDYTVKYTKNKDAGTAKITITGKGNYQKKTEKEFVITGLDITKADAAGVLLKSTGKVQKGKPVVRYELNGKTITLKEGKDYTLEHPGTDPKKAGYDPDAFVKAKDHTLYVVGKGNFDGRLAVTETITDHYLMSKMSYVVKDNEYDGGKPVVPSELSVKNGKSELQILQVEKSDLSGSGEARNAFLAAKGSAGYDCVYYYENNMQAGDASVTFVGTAYQRDGLPGYEGTVTKTYKVKGIPIGSAKIDGLQKSYLLGDTPVDPFHDETVQLSDKTTGALLAIETAGNSATCDYTVRLVSGSMTAQGTVKVEIVGRNRYSGKVAKSYKIDGTPITGCSFDLPGINDLVYTGVPIEPAMKIMAPDGKTQLAAGTDYTVTCSKNINAGRAQAVVRGIGRYKGSKTVSYQIKPQKIDAGNDIVVEEIGDVPYMKNGTKPNVTVRRKTADGWEILAAGKDYKVTYQNHTAVNVKAVAIIQGAGNYAGTVRKEFLVVKGKLSDVTVTAKDVVYQTNGGLYKKAAITLTDLNGVKLSAGKDYTIVEYRYVCDTPNVMVKNPENGYFMKDPTRGKRGALVSPEDIIPAGTEIKAVLKSCSNDYEGTAEVVFKIVKNDISKAKVKIVPKPEYTPGGKSELYKTDIEVSYGKEPPLSTDCYEIIGYQNNVLKGTAKVTIGGRGLYGGTKTVTYKIDARTFTSLEK